MVGVPSDSAADTTAPLNMYVELQTPRNRISPSPPPLSRPTAGSLAALSCSNIVFLFILGSGKYLPWATEAGRIQLGKVSACQISRRLLPANVSVIGMVGNTTRRPPPPGGGATNWKFDGEDDGFVRWRCAAEKSR